MTHDQFKIWLAGFFDGEGSVGLATGNNACVWRSPRVTLTQKGSTDLIMKIKELYGGSVSKHTRSGVNQWNLSKAADVIKFLEDILPYLQIKSARAEVILAIAQIIESGKFHNTFGYTPASEEITQKRMELEMAYDSLGPSREKK